MFLSGEAFDASAEVDPAAVRQDNVQQDHVWLFLAQDAQAIRARARLEDLITGCAQKSGGCREDNDVVINDEESYRALGRSFHSVNAF